MENPKKFGGERVAHKNPFIKKAIFLILLIILFISFGIVFSS